MQQHYQLDIQTALVAQLAYIDRKPDRISIKLRGGGRVDDHGDRLLTKAGQDHEIQAAIALAKVKGWQRIAIITGSDDFKARARLEIERAGLQVVGSSTPQPSTSDDIVKAERERLARARSNVPSHTSTPRPR